MASAPEIPTLSEYLERVLDNLERWEDRREFMETPQLPEPRQHPKPKISRKLDQWPEGFREIPGLPWYAMDRAGRVMNRWGNMPKCTPAGGYALHDCATRKSVWVNRKKMLAALWPELQT